MNTPQNLSGDITKEYVDQQVTAIAHLEEAIYNRNMHIDRLKIALGRIAQGWHLVVVPIQTADLAEVWCARNEIVNVRVDSYEFFTGTDETECHRNAMVFIIEDKERAALFKTFFG